jgi:hypothetical protein
MRSSLVTVAIATYAMIGPAFASTIQRADVEIGTLSCSVNARPAASSSETPLGQSQLRDAICTFHPRQGAEETYMGTVQGLKLSPDKGGVAIWRVKADSETTAPGFLQQSYAVDRAVPADLLSPLVGETNPSIVLHSMADRPEGSASATQRPRPQGFVVVGLNLRLRSAAV